MSQQNKWGVFPWYSLATAQPEKSGAFYRQLLNLKIGEFEMPGMGKTLVLQKGEKSFADLTNVPPMTPCHWMPYITVEKVEEYLPKAKKWGGSIIGEPFDIPTIGRGCLIKDPSGAIFTAYTPLDWNYATSAMGMEEGNICWNELMVEDPQKVIPFYSESFGWKFKLGDNLGELVYHSCTNVAGEQIGGIMKRPAHVSEMPPMWMPYFLAPDLEATTKKAATLGGTVFMPPTVIPHTGTFSMIQDPQGAELYLFKGL